MKVNISDLVRIFLLKGNEIIGEIPTSNHTWQTAGLKGIRDMSGDSGISQSYYIDEMRLKADTSTDTITINSQDDTVATFEGSWGTGTIINDIGTIEILHGNTVYSKVTCTLFDKDNDTSLVINWKSTVTGDWGYGLTEIARWLALTIAPDEIDEMIVVDTGATETTITPDFTAEGDTISIWESTFTTLGGDTVDKIIIGSQFYEPGYSTEDVTNFVIPSGVDLVVNWRTTFSPG